MSQKQARDKRQEQRAERKRIQRKNRPRVANGAFSQFATRLVWHVEKQAIARWLKGFLPGHYGDEESSLEQLVDRAVDQDGMRIETDPAPAAQYYRLVNAEGVTISGLTITRDQMLAETAKLRDAARLIIQQRKEAKADEDDHPPVECDN